jgi:hypothetical protein
MFGSSARRRQVQVQERFDEEEVGYSADTNTKAELIAEDRHTKTRSIAADRRRENHLFCGCCCDYRRATIVVNMVNIVCCFLVLFFGVGGGFIKMATNNSGVQNVEISTDFLLGARCLMPVWDSSCLSLESMVLSIIRNGL